MTEKKPGAEAIERRRLAEALGRFPTIDAARLAPEWRVHRPFIGHLFDEPKVYEAKSARPRLRAFLRAVMWNIEHGAQLGGVVEALDQHPILRYADLLLLNEVDIGCARSAGLDIAGELSRRLSAHAVYAAEYLELSGEEIGGLHGNAILTRHAFAAPRVTRLARCEDNFASPQKRLGGRRCLTVEIDTGRGALLAATAHLDVVNTPHCRARQMAGALDAIEANLVSSSMPVLFGGDLNTHTFARGGRLRALAGAWRVLASNRERLAQRLLFPEAYEPAFAELRRLGFDFESFNDRAPTIRTRVSALEDAERLPGLLRGWAMRRIGPQGLWLDFRLDWFAARGLRALSDGEAKDEASGVVSLRPQVVAGLMHKGRRVADHDPIVVDVAIDSV